MIYRVYSSIQIQNYSASLLVQNDFVLLIKLIQNLARSGVCSLEFILYYFVTVNSILYEG